MDAMRQKRHPTYGFNRDIKVEVFENICFQNVFNACGIHLSAASYCGKIVVFVPMITIENRMNFL
jgi:hypothetical protein